MINLTREEAQQVLDALCELEHDTFHPAKVFKHKPSINLLRARLAQPELEQLGEIVPADEEQLNRIAKLVQPEPVSIADKLEPVAWMLTELDGTPLIDCGDLVVKPRPVLVGDKTDCIPLYTAPSKRNWQGLTDEEIEEVCGLFPFYSNEWCDSDYVDFARAIEAKLKEKNHG